MTRNPDRTEVEIILACDLTARNDWRALPDTDPEVQALSALLQGLPLHPPGTEPEPARPPA